MCKMRISGNIGQGELGYVRPFVLCETPEISGPIRMVVDTGASRTTISERDAIRLGIDYETLTCPEDNSVIGIGGTCLYYLTGEVALVFRVSRDSWHTERLDSVLVLKSNDDEMAALRVPSLLGRDILSRYSVRFTRTKVILEK